MTTLTTAQTTETITVETEETETELERVKRIMMEAARRNRRQLNMGPFPAFDKAAHWTHGKFARGLSEEDYRQFQVYIREVEAALGQRSVEDFDELAQTVPQDRRESYCLWALGVTAGYEPEEREKILAWLKIKLARLFGGNAAADEWIQRHTAPTTPKKPKPRKQHDDHTGHRAKDPQSDAARTDKRLKIRPDKGKKPTVGETDVAAQETAPTAPVMAADDGYEPPEAEVRERAAEIQRSNADVFETVDETLLVTARDQLVREHRQAVIADQQPEPVEAPRPKKAKRSRGRRPSEAPAAETPAPAATA